MASLLLKNFPPDIRKYLMRLQMEHKIETGVGQYSLESAIYKIIRSKMKSENKK